MRLMQSPQSATIAFIGGGNMARALIAGLLRQAVAPGSDPCG
jgi:pyrroline-5-carboxylate reductase